MLAVLALQVFCAGYFAGDIILAVLGIDVVPLAWEYREYLEIGAAVALIAGVVLGARQLNLSLKAQHDASERLRRASSAFMDMVEERFGDWALTPAERDVALFLIKGMSIAETAALRGTSEGTIKAQATAIYRKAGVSGRPQLLSLFIEDLFDPTPDPVPAPPDGALPAGPANLAIDPARGR